MNWAKKLDEKSESFGDIDVSKLEYIDSRTINARIGSTNHDGTTKFHTTHYDEEHTSTISE